MLALVPAVCAVGDPEPKQLPSVGQGRITPSGKFTPGPLVAPTNSASVQSASELEAALKLTSKLQLIGSNVFQIGQAQFDSRARAVMLTARVAVRTQVVEYALVTERGKAYESLFTTTAEPTDVHLSFLLLGIGQAELGGPFNQAAPSSPTNELSVEVSWETNGHHLNFRLSEFISLTENRPSRPAGPMTVEKWLYNGSAFDGAGFAAQREGSLISLIRDPAALINNPGPDRDNDQIHLPQEKLLPPEGWPVRITLRLPTPPAEPQTPLPPWVSPLTPFRPKRD